MENQSIDETIRDADISKDLTIYAFFNEDNALLADLRWDGATHQLYIQSQTDGLQIKFDGHIHTPSLVSSIQEPIPGQYLTIAKGLICYLKDQPLTTDSRYAIDANASYLIINDCTLNPADYSKGVKFDLRCDYSGVQGEKGYVTILSSVDYCGN